MKEISKYISPLRALRRKKEITQRDLAAVIGVSETYIAMLETGIRTPSLPMLERIAIGLDANLKIELIENERPS